MTSGDYLLAQIPGLHPNASNGAWKGNIFFQMATDLMVEKQPIFFLDEPIEGGEILCSPVMRTANTGQEFASSITTQSVSDI